MKKKKALSVLLLASMVAGMLAGCGSGNGSTEAADTVAELGEDYDGTITLPLCEEKTTLTMWIPADSTFFSMAEDYNDSEFFQELEERTNVHIEFDVPTTGEETTAFNLMISSGELPDIICSSSITSMYADGLDAAIDDGFYLDLTPYLDSYLYNYNSVRQTSDYFMKNSVTDSGRCAYIPILNTETQGPWMGMQIREDWLDELNLDTPVTYDDLEEVLIAFRDQKGCYAPLALSSYGNYVFGEMSAGFGVIGSYFNKDGTVVAGFATDEWRQYLTLMNKWYEEGLIDPDYTSHSAFMVENDLVATEQTGVWCSMYTMAPIYESMLPEGANVTALASPKLNADDTLHIRLSDTAMANGGAAISAQSEHKELAMQWLDYLYTEAGADLANYGIEGETYTVNDDGSISYTDLIINNPDGLTPTQALITRALIPSEIPSHYDWTRELVALSEEDIASYDIWGADDHLDDWVMPSGITLTADENIEFASYNTDITTYFQEQSNQFITGVLDIESDSDWNTYIDTLNSMGLERCVEIEQAGLDRYLAR